MIYDITYHGNERGGVKPAAFAYRRASSVSEAVSLLQELGEGAKIIAGGQSLVPMMAFRLARPAALVDVSRIRDLAFVRPEAGGLTVGALTLHRALEEASELDGFEILREAAPYVGHYPIRSRGTFGGSLAHCDPSAEWCVLALALGAEIVAAGPSGERTIPVDDFFKGFLMTALAPGELLTEVRFPHRWSHTGFTELSRRHGDFALVAAAVALDLDGTRCIRARVALGGVGGTALRSPECERALEGTVLDAASIEAAAGEAATSIDPPSDVHASSRYRKTLARLLVARALERALARPVVNV